MNLANSGKVAAEVRLPLVYARASECYGQAVFTTGGYLGLLWAAWAQQLLLGHVKALAPGGSLVSWSQLYLSTWFLAKSRWVMSYQISCFGP